MILNRHNPDVLMCLANLSNDEVFTPPKLANEMLDILPSELWSNPHIKFLDPFCKSGVFLREIAKRLIKGLEQFEPDLQKRVNHIMEHQVYGIAITELTALMARRSLYCTKKANGKYSVTTAFDTVEGNIAYNKIEHTFQNGKCTYCGANEKTYDRDDDLETHAYQFIHNHNSFENMQFDVIIGNPPYHLSDGGGTGDSATPIYHLFVQQAIKLEPKYLTMIIPSRWMKGGKGLSAFRREMINDRRISLIFDYEYAKECFEGLNVDGGASYFLWDASHNNEVDYYYKPKDGEVIYSKRFLANRFEETVIRDFRQSSLIEKSFSFNEERFSEIVSTRNPYGFNADLFNNPGKYKYAKLSSKSYNNAFKIYGVKGKKGGAKRVIGYILDESIPKNHKAIDKYKLFFSKAYMTTSTVPPEIIVGIPGTLCTETFLEIGPFLTKEQVINCLTYIKTKFFRALLFYMRSSLNISQKTFSLVPLQDFSEPWTDEKLYKKYNLTQEEINFIESMIRPME